MAKKERLDEQKALEILRRNQHRLLAAKNVTSCGVGYRVKNGERTNELCIQCTVEQKATLEELAARGINPLPEEVVDDGYAIPIDVVERSYKPSYQLDTGASPQSAVEDAHEIRRSRLDPIRPGASVSHIDGTAGTIGAIVFDKESGEPLILSNWHVLHGPTGAYGDTVVQPGPYDDPDVAENSCGLLVRSVLGMAGDCAVATIEGRTYEQAMLETNTTPKRIATANLDDLVVKSGRTTGVTYGIVSRVGVVVKLNYGDPVGTKEIGGFEIRVNPDKPPENGEVSMGGDSGSLWMIDGDDTSSDIAVGLHFAGEVDPDPNEEHAVACKITSVCEKLKITFEDPISPEDAEVAVWQQVFERIARLEEALATSKSCNCHSQNGDASPAEVGDDVVAAENGIPIHGNWCGPGHGGGEVRDLLDGACKRHDECYDASGYFNCDCDRVLVRDVDRLIRGGTLSPALRAKAFVVRQYFASAPCSRYIRFGNRRIPVPGSNSRNNLGRAATSAGRSLGRSAGNAGRSIRRALGL